MIDLQRLFHRSHQELHLHKCTLGMQNPMAARFFNNDHCCGLNYVAP